MNSMRRANSFISTLLVATFLTGCSLAPTYKKPDVSVPEDYKENLDGKWKQASNNAGSADQSNWWQVFNDKDLNDLETQADAANNDLKVAAARLDQARGLTEQARAGYFPEIDLGANAYRGNSASASFGAAGSNAKPITALTVSGGVSYDADLFGNIRSTANAAKYNEAAVSALYQQAVLMVHADVASNYFMLQSLDTEADLLRETIKLRKDAADLLQHQYKEGEASEQDNLRAQADLATTQADLASVEQQRSLMEHALAVLVGKTPAEFKLAEKKLPQSLPVVPAGLPSAMLERRPDIAAAENNLKAANERIGAARAAFFPDLLLTAAGGVTSNELGNLFKWSSRSWGLGPLLGTALSMPLFDGGERAGLLKQAKGAYQENVADYRQQVLVAFKDVEDNLSNLRLQDEQAKRLYTAADASGKAYHISDVRYKEGESSYLEVIDTQRDMLTAQRAYTQIQGARFVTTVNLIRALGGGWNNLSLTQQPATEVKPDKTIETKSVEQVPAVKAEVEKPAEEKAVTEKPVEPKPVAHTETAPITAPPALASDEMNP
jgi:multidrug efflux system outer membrane protein